MGHKHCCSSSLGAPGQSIFLFLVFCLRYLTVLRGEKQGKASLYNLFLEPEVPLHYLGTQPQRSSEKLLLVVDRN